MKKILYLIAFLTITLSAKAQYSAVPDTARISLGIDAANPESSFSDRYSVGLGASLQFDYPLTEHIYVTANGGYMTFFPNNSKAGTNPIAIENLPLANMSTAPFKIGLKLFLIRTFYVQAEAGETLLLNKTAVYALNSSAFTFGPQMGIIFKLKNRSYIDGGIRFQETQSFYGDGKYNPFLGLRVAYALNL